MKNFLKYILGWSVCSNSFAQTQAQLEAIKKGKELFGDLKARHIGPALMSGRVTDIETHPKNDRIVYIGTAGGGVWKSNNGGATFNSIFDDYCQSIGAVEVDPNDPDNVIWVGTGEVWTRNSVSIGDGLYRSKDGGSSWEKMGLETSERISSIQINPKNSLEVYVGVLGPLWSDSESRGLYKTSDGGKTWTKILYVDLSTGCSDLQIDTEDPSVLYASFWEFRRSPWSFSSGGDKSALYKSTDAGKTWNKIHNGFPKGKLGRLAIAIAPSNNKILYTVVESEQDKDKGLYRSDDAGASWKFSDGTGLKGIIDFGDGNTMNAEEAQTAISDEVYYIVPDKCTECVGFHEEPQCAAVCPVDCCIKDDDNVEAEDVLLAKKDSMHL